MARQSKAAATAASSKVAKSGSKVKGAKVTKADPPKVTRKAKRGKKDPNAPKRALSAYMFFSQAKRTTVKEKNPDASFGNIGKLLGDMWKKMSEDEKKPFNKQAEADKKRYEAEKASYQGADGSEEEESS
ncbi:Non-histone chromosomal protein 6 [Coemansia erecta]|uniref:Non-histone chromosomal protein 6 n=1 Tax=Coemansia erecta TaxID=147472 RepID=A0A9W7Y394_9FUNG|nr:Non-histone chromosomal protein 6 [Coemansia erecta]